MHPQLNKKIHGLRLLIMVTVVSLVYGCQKGDHPPILKEESADVVFNWYKFIALLQRPVAPQPVPLAHFRNFAYIGVGLYESVRPGINGAVSFSSTLYQMPAMPEPDDHKAYLWSESANAALASMFKQFLTNLTDANKTSIDSFENVVNDKLRSWIPDAVFTRSQSFGRSIATDIYNWSTTDNFNLSATGYTIPVFPGSWEPTPPAFAPPLGPFLKNSRPFLEYSLTAALPSLPFPYSEDPSSDFYAAAKDVYDVGKGLTPEQAAISEWWADAGGPGVGVPAPYHVLSIITGVLEKKGAKLAKAAEVYAKTGIAMKDVFFIVWRAKYQYNLVRPVTYIQKHIDPTWLSHIPTPPYPEFISGLAGIYSSTMQVLIRSFGDIPITDNTYDWRGLAPRQYASINQLIDEAAVSRVYGGIHYRFTQNITPGVGKALGNQIADINLSRHSNY